MSALRFWPLMGLVLGACGPDRTPPIETPPVPDASIGEALPDGFRDAVDQTSVPLEILLGIAATETRFQMVVGEEEFPGQAAAYGAMALRGDRIQQAADLTGLDPELIRTDRIANIVGAAALLEQWALDQGIVLDDLAAWGPVVATYSGIQDPEAQTEYVHNEVFSHINRGFDLEGFSLEGQAVIADFPTPKGGAQRLGDSDSVWTASPNHSSRGGADADMVIIHTCEGSYTGCWSWLSNSSSGVSAHYVVNHDGSEVRWLVDEERKAWHIGADYDCDRNDQ